ncbi:MAG: AAA family ATPase [Synergistaceae bacterium]|nr:AAA family ATPase [Synergistaceae bacterium]
MGVYLNPGSSGFEAILASKYVDKTGLIRLINDMIGTMSKLTCVSRPRRFGKSYAAQMLCAYYGKGPDSHVLFDGLNISQDPSYAKHLNKYDVIYLDMTNILGNAGAERLIPFIEDNVTREILEAYPGVSAGNSFDQALAHMVEHEGNKVIMIIDEWDAPIREEPGFEKEYLKFLRTLFKSSNTTSKIFAAAYMTGILPIRKDGSQSAISDFEEYTIIKPRQFSEFVGFTEKEVKCLCEENRVDFTTMKHWYDGYTTGSVRSIYNPNSVMKAIRYRDFYLSSMLSGHAGIILR